MTAKKETNIGVALNRRLELVIKQQQRINALERRVKKLENMPSIEGDQLLKYLTAVNRKVGLLLEDKELEPIEIDVPQEADFIES